MGKRVVRKPDKPQEGDTDVWTVDRYGNWLMAEIMGTMQDVRYPDHLKRRDSSGLFEIHVFWNFPHLLRCDVKRISGRPTFAPMSVRYAYGAWRAMDDSVTAEKKEKGNGN